MGNFLETIYDVIFQPQKAMRSIAERRLAGQALFLFFVSMLMIPPWNFRNAIGGALSLPAPEAAFVIELLGCFILWFFAASVLSIIAEICGGRGSAVGLFAALGFACLPRIVVMPLWALVAFLPERYRAAALGIIGTIVLVWIFLLSIEAVRASHGLSFGRAVLVLSLPVLALAGIVIGLVFFAGIAFLS